MGVRGRWAPDVIVVLGLLVLHFSLRRFLVGWPVMPSFLIGALLLGALRLRAGNAALFGFFLGLLEAAMGLEGMGITSFVFTLVGYLGARSRDLLFADARHYVFTYLFVGTWVAEAALMLAMPGEAGLVGPLLLAPVSALVTAILCGSAEAVAAALRRP
ncbi:MAG: rod shape-determining protein MreD [marine benthic group bacterium]|jgi:cell shape-determining protein MreD|nr:rod shape-determining protein MreD [Candidatus Benthicola marisminoris]